MARQCWECGKQLHNGDEVIAAIFYSSEKGLHGTFTLCEHDCLEKTEMRVSMTLVDYETIKNKRELD